MRDKKLTYAGVEASEEVDAECAEEILLVVVSWFACSWAGLCRGESMDGHNGSAAAIYSKENLLNNVLSAIPSVACLSSCNTWHSRSRHLLHLFCFGASNGLLV
ncbi:putative protein phosphatase 2C 12 [Camellia lanceoleosa]|uniref:Uncharacterized protein n=1 Tax=Camellia lanceoleosa TaxID=1840588 RepID=A0ACC0H639_9ERIC|nr:putative protein phosphatase 2C 12 [Camellia lanceoleosa]